MCRQGLYTTAGKPCHADVQRAAAKVEYQDVSGVSKRAPDGEVADGGHGLFNEVHVRDPGEPPGLAQSLTRQGVRGFFNRAFFWTDERTTIPYDLWVIAILAFVWLTPPDWIGDPMAVGGRGLLQYLFGW